MSAPLEGSENMEKHSIGSGHDLRFEPWSSFVAIIRGPLHQTWQASALDSGAIYKPETMLSRITTLRSYFSGIQLCSATEIVSLKLEYQRWGPFDKHSSVS
jgi:hypothetical protein